MPQVDFTDISRLIHLIITNKGRRDMSFFMPRDSNMFKTQITLDPERFEPSSRNFLIGEQPNPWDLIYLLSGVTASIRLFHHHFFFVTKE